MALTLTTTLETEEEGAQTEPAPAPDGATRTVDVQAELAALRAELAAVRGAPAAPMPAGPLLVDPRTLPPLEPESPREGLDVAFTVHLPPRFALYLRHRAAAHGEGPETHLAGILRHFWKDDLWRQTSTAPTGPGQPAGTSRR